MPTSTNLTSLLFADDTTALACGDNLDTIGPHINTELQKIGMWLRANELAINTSKTKIMIFSNAKKIHDFNFVFNENDLDGPQNPDLISKIERIKSNTKISTFKMLGVHFDEVSQSQMH